MIRFALRIPEDLHTRLAAQAATDRRSINSEILHLLEVELGTRGADSESLGSDSDLPASLREKPESSRH
ncbi:Arc family DNA-binding protein [Streptomyces sp. PU-14G]|uniref:Arc family DNA-binding protein n=1 Tax=Streptomyces sp. PU-14G TaxID=2800808 RepID=UPI0034DFC8D6